MATKALVCYIIMGIWFITFAPPYRRISWKKMLCHSDGITQFLIYFGVNGKVQDGLHNVGFLDDVKYTILFIAHTGAIPDMVIGFMKLT